MGHPKTATMTAKSGIYFWINLFEIMPRVTGGLETTASMTNGKDMVGILGKGLIVKTEAKEPVTMIDGEEERIGRWLFYRW